MKSSNIKIYVVGHKKFVMPTNDSIYVPMLVGDAHNIDMPGAVRDNTGDNIAEKNSTYNEITALYWIWKNSDADIVGLCHYRRYFTSVRGKVENLIYGKIGHLLSSQYIEKEMKSADIILHNKTFFFNGNRKQLTKGPNYSYEANKAKLSEEILELIDQCFCDFYPNEKIIFEKVMNRRSAHLLNMFVCRKDILDAYCMWLFPFLLHIENRINQEFGKVSQRLIGLVAERLLDVWVSVNGINVCNCFSINVERKDWKPWG